MICSTRSRDKFVKEGLDYSTAKYKATYAFYYLPNEIAKVAQRVQIFSEGFLRAPTIFSNTFYHGYFQSQQ